MSNQMRIFYVTFILLLGWICTQSPLVINAESFPIKDRKITLSEDLQDDKKPITNSESIIKLTNEDLTLAGLTDYVELYYEVPFGGIEDGSSLNLFLQYSDLLLKGSTVTILIDDSPVYSANIEANKNEMKIEIPLEDEAVEVGYHQLAIYFHGHISEIMCVNEENPANWFTVLSESYLSLLTKDMSDRENVLQDYPYPFIQNNQEQTVKGTIVIPDDASVPLLTATMKLANYLNSQTGADEVVPIMTESELTKVSSHIIAIGAIDEWTGTIKCMVTSINPTVSDHELLIDNYFLKFPKEEKQFMLITGHNDETILDKIPVLSNSSLIAQLAGDHIVIEELPSIPKDEIKQKQAFTDLNIPDLTLTGQTTKSQNYFIKIPPYTDLHGDSVLQLKLKASDTLFQQDELVNINKQEAELVVYINEIPHSIAIDNLDNKSEGSFYEIDIPIDSTILREANYLTIKFQANGLMDPDFCVSPNDEKWIFIHEDSYLEIPTVTEIPNANSFKTWPAPFVSESGLHDLAILIPHKYDQHVINQLYLLTNELGNQMNLDGLELIVDQNIELEKLENQNVIVLGNISDHRSLEKFADELIIGKNNSNDLNISAYEFLNETSKFVAWMQPSVWNSNKTMAIFSAIHQEETNFLSKNMVDFITTNTINTNIIVESINGEIFTHKIDENIESHEEIPNTEQENIDPKDIKWLVGGFIAILFVGVIMFVYFYRKGKQKD